MHPLPINRTGQSNPTPSRPRTPHSKAQWASPHRLLLHVHRYRRIMLCLNNKGRPQRRHMAYRNTRHKCFNSSRSSSKFWNSTKLGFWSRESFQESTDSNFKGVDKSSHHFTLAYCSWSNGTVEVVFRELLRSTRAILSEFQILSHHWPSIFPECN